MTDPRPTPVDDSASAVAAPAERFNIAQHLLALNAQRGPKPAFIDDAGSLSYAALDDSVRRLATGLRSAGLRREERVLLLMQDCTDWPVCFLGALYGGMVPVAVNTLLMPERPTPEATFKRWQGGVAGVRPTVFFGAPTGFAGMLAHPALPARDAVSLRLVSSAGEALPAELGERFQRHFGVDIIDGIGSTEMLHIFSSNRPERARYGSTGWPVPGYQEDLRGEDGAAVADGMPGDLYIQGPSAALMYWGKQAKTRDTFQGPWTKSGDKYMRNADGSYTYSGRSDDMLKVSGIYVSPFEAEATLVQHPAVLEAAVIGKADAEGLVKTKAFVVLKAGASADEAELKAFVKDRLAPYKYPRSIEFVADLPKTATGKIQRFKLRELESGRH